MIEVISLLMAVGVGAFVIVPLLKKQTPAALREAKADGRVSELLYRQNMLSQTMDDLEFDYQMGKLSPEDYESLVADQQKNHKDVNARLKDISGISGSELIERLEKEISQAKLKVAPATALLCPSCKRPIQKEDKFCSACGAKIN